MLSSVAPVAVRRWHSLLSNSLDSSIKQQPADKGCVRRADSCDPSPGPTAGPSDTTQEQTNISFLFFFPLIRTCTTPFLGQTHRAGNNIKDFTKSINILFTQNKNALEPGKKTFTEIHGNKSVKSEHRIYFSAPVNINEIYGHVVSVYSTWTNPGFNLSLFSWTQHWCTHRNWRKRQSLSSAALMSASLYNSLSA